MLGRIEWWPVGADMTGPPSVILGAEPPFILSERRGFGSNQESLIAQTAPFQRGFTPVGTQVSSRRLSVRGAIVADTRQDMLDLRRQFAGFFAGALGPLSDIPPLGMMHYVLPDGQVFMLACRAIDSPALSGAVHTIADYDIEFEAPDPYWQDHSFSVVVLSDPGQGFTFPMTFPFVLAAAAFNQKTVTNSGHVQTSPRIVIAGPVTDPQVTNLRTNETIFLHGSLVFGERWEVETAFGSKSVIRIDTDGNGTDDLAALDPTSRFWQLPVGDSEVELVAAEGVDATVEIRFKNRYAGV